VDTDEAKLIEQIAGHLHDIYGGDNRTIAKEIFDAVRRSAWFQYISAPDYMFD
jgi:hypothetical protein